MTVSVIITVYNAAQFLDESIASVAAQAFHSWELLIVDDGSTDSSAHIAKHWASQDSRIQPLAHPGNRNRGISASRNLGILHSHGEFIAFLDADDVWLPGKLEGQLHQFKAHPEAAMTFAAAERWYSWNGAGSDFLVPSAIPGHGSDCLLHPPALLDAFLKDESLTPCTCTVLARKDAVLRAGAFENSFPGLFDDQVFYAKLSLAEPVYVSSTCVARYRQHDKSCCATARQNGSEARERERFLNWLSEYRNCSR